MENAFISHLSPFPNKFFGYIFKFAEYLLGRKICTYRESSHILYLNGDNESIKKLKEIYNTKDISLLAFYELVLLEINNLINYGFLSALETQFLYDFTMKGTINKLTGKQSQKMNKINKKEKRLRKKKDNRISKLKINKREIFEGIKISLWKTRAPIKTKKNNKYNNRY